MTREDLLEYSIGVSDLCKKLLDLEQRVEVLEGERAIQANVNKLQKERADNLECRVTHAEKTNTNNAQYLRRRQLEISNVHEEIDDERLPKVVASFLSNTGVNVNEDDLEKCHRLKKKSTVIMEFGSRSLRDSVLMSRKKLEMRRKETNELGLGNSM